MKCCRKAKPYLVHTWNTSSVNSPSPNGLSRAHAQGVTVVRLCLNAHARTKNRLGIYTCSGYKPFKSCIFLLASSINYCLILCTCLNSTYQRWELHESEANVARRAGVRGHSANMDMMRVRAFFSSCNCIAVGQLV